MLLQELLKLTQERQLTRGPEMNLMNRKLTSLQGLHIPDIIEGQFSCDSNKLTSLQYGPTEVEAGFFCYSNKLTSLEYCPTKVGKAFSCTDNQLRNLQYAPDEIGETFSCWKNQLTSLEGCPNKIVGNFHCWNNQLTNLKGIHKLFKGGYIKGKFDLDNNPITSHILGLLLIPELKEVKYKAGNPDCIAAVKIINKHLAADRDVVDCQQELIEAGLKQYAQL